MAGGGNICGSCHILLVEDNPAEVRLSEEAFKERQYSDALRNRLSVVNDGIQAFDFLHSNGRHADTVRPDLILLDLNISTALKSSGLLAALPAE